MRAARVIWHDLECHGYAADLPLWQKLAAEQPGPILDVGAGTGRVSLDLAAAGHAVTALDNDPVLLGALRARAADRGLDVATVVADAQHFDLGRTFTLILVPMQTIQLFSDRPAFLAAARAHMTPGGLLAIALAENLIAFEPDWEVLPDPDVGEVDGHSYVSQPTALRLLEDVARIERTRTITGPDGATTSERDVIELANVDAGLLEFEGEDAGLTPEAPVLIGPTVDYVGTEVVMLRG